MFFPHLNLQNKKATTVSAAPCTDRSGFRLLVQFQLSKYFPNLSIDHTAQLFQPLPFHRDVRVLPEDEALQIHKVAADGIGQQSPGCHHKIPPEPGRKPRNILLGMGQLVIIQVKQQAAVVIEHRRHDLDLHGVGIKQPLKSPRWRSISRITASRTIRRNTSSPPIDALQSFSLYFPYYLALYGWAVSITPLVDSLQPHLSEWLAQF